jgi:hypothetical protein
VGPSALIATWSTVSEANRRQATPLGHSFSWSGLLPHSRANPSTLPAAPPFPFPFPADARRRRAGQSYDGGFAGVRPRAQVSPTRSAPSRDLRRFGGGGSGRDSSRCPRFPGAVGITPGWFFFLLFVSGPTRCCPLVPAVGFKAVRW